MNKITNAVIDEVDRHLLELFRGFSRKFQLDGDTRGVACDKSVQMINSYISGRRKLHPNNSVVRRMIGFSETHLAKYLEYEKNKKLEDNSPNASEIDRQMCAKWVNDGLRGLNARIGQFKEEMPLPYQVAIQKQNQRSA